MAERYTKKDQFPKSSLSSRKEFSETRLPHGLLLQPGTQPQVHLFTKRTNVNPDFVASIADLHCSPLLSLLGNLHSVRDLQHSIPQVT